jgi:hypothetical protein
MISDLLPASGPDLAALNLFLKSLHDADWEDPHGVFRFNNDTPLAELGAADFLQNTRLFLQALAEENGTAATATGNLNRVFVRRMFEELKLSPVFRATTLRVCKVINEMDLWPLHSARVVAELGRLVAKRNGRFVLTKPGRDLLAIEQAGALFRHLFITFFRKLDLRYVAGFRNVPEIQQTMAITLWRLADVARDWRAVKGIAGQILPPRVAERMRATMRSEYETEEWIICAYVLMPLLDFGLIERQHQNEWSGINDEDVIRVTSLFRRFVSFPKSWSPWPAV